MRNFKYCQSEIEDSGKCESQCSHCKEYYKELDQRERFKSFNDQKPIIEEGFKHEVKVLTDEEIRKGRSSAYKYIDFDREENN